METKSENTKIEQVKKTPFHIVTTEKEGKEVNFVVLGMTRVSPLFPAKQQAQIYATKNNNWELICATIGVMAERVLNDILLSTKKQ